MSKSSMEGGKSPNMTKHKNKAPQSVSSAELSSSCCQLSEQIQDGTGQARFTSFKTHMLVFL